MNGLLGPAPRSIEGLGSSIPRAWCRLQLPILASRCSPKTSVALHPGSSLLGSQIRRHREQCLVDRVAVSLILGKYADILPQASRALRARNHLQRATVPPRAGDTEVSATEFLARC